MQEQESVGALTTDDFILNEYKARQLWERREYVDAIEHTRSAAETAAARSDEAGWWRMTYLLAECQRELGLIDECVKTTKLLSDHRLTLEDPELAAKAKALRSAGLRSLGQLPEALKVAREAALEFPETGHGSRGKHEAQQVLVAVLAETGNLEDAWREAQTLASMVDDATEPEKAGKSYWVVGNVAFLSGRNQEGAKYHDLAATRISPSNDVNLWAHFNKASAFMRLTANLVEPETLQCIERAEMAISVSKGTLQDELDIDVIRAHWRYLTGDIAEAKAQMDRTMMHANVMSPLSEGDARLLYARILHANGNTAAAVQEATSSVTMFDEVGSIVRADLARNFLSEIGAVSS